MAYSVVCQWRQAFAHPPLRMPFAKDDPKEQNGHEAEENGPFHNDSSLGCS